MNLNTEEIKNILPHREPFLFVDEVTELDKWKKIVARYSFPADSFFFKGHFPGSPIVPGVLILEAIAQSAGILAYKSDEITYRDCGVILMKVESATFRKIVKPADVLTLSVDVDHKRGSVLKFHGKAETDGDTCAQARFIASFVRES